MGTSTNHPLAFLVSNGAQAVLNGTGLRIDGVGGGPSARLHVGVGDTSTTSEEVRISSSNGANAASFLSLYRNTTSKRLSA